MSATVILGAITDVPGFTVGHWTGAGTGVTVLCCPPRTIGSGEVRGGAPATREFALLEPSRTVEHVDAVVFSGGSAFGLAAADGVTAWLAAAGRGVPTPGGPVPIVPAASLYDLVASGGERPGPDEGRSAIAAAGLAPDRGRVGAGRGVTVGKWRGVEHSVPGGLGMASARVDDATIGALAVVNALGDVLGADGRMLAGSTAPATTQGFAAPVLERGATTLVVLATDARATKLDCQLLAQSGHHGLALAIRPSHTRFDGDVVIALATGSHDAQLDRLRAAATEVVAAAIRDAVGQT
jgi:L-aminopeptidase/D-esterase-like protein